MIDRGVNRKRIKSARPNADVFIQRIPQVQTPVDAQNPRARVLQTRTQAQMTRTQIHQGHQEMIANCLRGDWFIILLSFCNDV